MHDNFLDQAITQYQTPFYVFDTDTVVDQVNKIKAAVGKNVELCYAMKANPFIVREMNTVIDCYEVCSPGEFHICERAGLPMDKIILSGVYKNSEDIEKALINYGNKIVYTVESFTQWEMIREFSGKHSIGLRVLLRLTNGNQFGMDEEIIRQIISNREEDSSIEIEGIQYFSGTQKKSIKKIAHELNMLDDFCDDLQKSYGFTANRCEYGPGLPICYFEEEKNVEDTILLGLAEEIQKMKFGGKIVLEIGRFIAASCGAYVTSIVDTKTNHDQAYCIVDGGIHHLNYFGQMLAMKKPPIVHWNNRNGEQKEWTICGSLCTMNDVLVKQYPFVKLQIGDKLIFKKVGAYSVTEGISLFLSRALPQVLLYSEKEGFRLARKSFPTDILNFSENKND